MLDQTRRFPDPAAPREPIFNVPPAVLGVLIVLGAVHVVRQIIPDGWDDQVLLHLSFFPGLVTYALDPSAVLDTLRTLAARGESGFREAQLGRFILMNAGPQPWSLLTYGLLHADWTHIGLNGLWLLAFGSPVARRLGTWRFLVFLAVGTVAGAVAHYAIHPFDLVPVIGASAAVSGCMGAALRFMFESHSPLSALFGLSDRGGPDAFERPLMPLRELPGNRRAMAFLVAWFFGNLLFGVGTLAFGSTGVPVAWQAHIGGFLCGLLALPLFDRRRPDSRSAAEDGSDAPPQVG